MLLAFNLGNTEIALGLWDTADGEAALVFRGALTAVPARTPDEYAVAIAQLFALYDAALDAVTDVIIASVVPSLTDAVVAAVARLVDATPAIVGPGMRTGLQMRIDTPAQLGADLVALAAAARAVDTPAVIVAMETATTLTVLDGAGAIAGVVILPGLGSSAAALERDAALLSQTPLTPPRRVIGRNTVDAVRAGLFYGEAARIDGLLDRIADELGAPALTVLATGRYAPAVAPLCRRPLDQRPDMLMEGLLALWRLNRR